MDARAQKDAPEVSRIERGAWRFAVFFTILTGLNIAALADTLRSDGGVWLLVSLSVGLAVSVSVTLFHVIVLAVHSAKRFPGDL